MRGASSGKRARLAAALALVVGGAAVAVRPHAAAAPDPAPAPATDPALDPVPPPCRLDDLDPSVPVRIFSVAEVAQIGARYAETNSARLLRIDSLLAAGAWGHPASGAARRTAHLMARLLTLNAYSYMTRYGADPDTVWQADESTLRPAFATFSDPGIVPLARLSRARMGLGAMCARYDLSETLRTTTVIGGRKFEVRIQDVSIHGRPTRVLRMDFPTSLHDVIEIWLCEHVCMDVTSMVSEGPPAPYEAQIIDHMRGLWVRKAGLHRPEAFVFYVTPRDSRRSEPPQLPLAGARIYVPRLKLRLPIIPDIGFEDLREVDLPQPILELEYLQEARQPRWLETAARRGFKHWDGVGPLPPALRARFPDL
jgi:hypothetical protein